MTATIRRWTHLSTLALALLASGPALAVDGVLEINQTCATLSGCFAGDAPGFPVTIASTGMSVRLTSDLVVPDEDTSAIAVNAGVRSTAIDLNGFALMGPVACTGNPASCPINGTGAGVAANQIEQITVRNGTVRGFGATGLDLWTFAHVEGVTVIENGVTGIKVNAGSIVTDSIVAQNGNLGIHATKSVVRDSVVRANGGTGILADRGLVVNNTITSNEGYGLHSVTSSAFGGNFLWNNQPLSSQAEVHPLNSVEIAPNLCGGDTQCF